jgi:hypothetical protein
MGWHGAVRAEGQLVLDPHSDATCSAEANRATERDLGFPNPCRG